MRPHRPLTAVRRFLFRRAPLLALFYWVGNGGPAHALDSASAQRLSQLNRLLNQAASQAQAGGPIDRQTLTALAQEREQLLIRAIRHDPGAAAQWFLAPPVREGLASLIGPESIEQAFTLTGRVGARIVDYAAGSSETRYVLHTAPMQAYELHGSPTSWTLALGKTIQISGVRVGSQLLVSTLDSTTSSSTSATSASQTPATTVERTAVLITSFAGASTTLTLNDGLTMIGQLNTFYQTTSYGRISVSGDAFGPFQLTLQSSCDLDTMAAAATQAAGGSAALADFDRIIVVAPFTQSQCGFDGISDLGGFGASPTFSLIGANYFMTFEVTGHEYGHQLGVGHASSINCGAGVSFCEPTSQNISEYGDAYDIMGNQNPVDMNVAQKEKLGWLDAGAGIQTVTTNGLYTLSELEVNDGGLKGLKIARGLVPGGTDYLFIEYRRQAPGGALLHAYEWNDYGSDDGIAIAKTILFSPAPLQAGNAVTDAVSGANIAILSAANGLLSVEINGLAAPPSSPLCDVNKDGIVNILDIQLAIVQALQEQPCTADVNLDGFCTILDVQRIGNAALGGACVAGP